MKTKIAMIVLNAVSHDIRVLKEAKSLKNANYDVSIIGLLDNNSLKYEEIDGIKIFRTEQNGIIVSTFVKSLKKHWKIKCFIAFIASYFILSNMNIIIPYVEEFLNYIQSMHFLSKPAPFLFFGIFFILFGDIIFGQIVKPINYFMKIIERNVLNLEKVLFEILSIIKRKKVFYKLLREIQPDIVHCHDLNSLIIGASYKKMKRGHCKLIYDSHEIFEKTNQSGIIRQNIFYFIQYFLSRKVDGFITVNKSIANYLCSKYPNLPQAYIIKNATVLKAIEKRENMFVKCYNVPENKKIVLFQGGFSHGRGLRELIRACKFFNDEWVVVFMGWGKLETTLMNDAMKHGLLNLRVFFCNRVTQEELPYWTSNATIGIIPYENTCLNHFYCSPNKLWEYTLAGVPILASPFPEMKKIIHQEVGWLLEDPVTHKNISDVINGLSDEAIQAAKRKTREFIKNDNWSKYEKRLFALYNSLSPIGNPIQ